MRTINMYQTFANFSGCKMNFQKSQAFHFGANKNMKQKHFLDKGLKWPTHDLHYLGIAIPLAHLNSQDQLFEINFDDFLSKARTILNMLKVVVLLYLVDLLLLNAFYRQSWLLRLWFCQSFLK